MPAPSAGNGLERAIKIILIPSTAVLFAVVMSLQLFGPSAAGLVLNAATLFTLLGIAGAAMFWNTEYTGMIAIGGTVVFFIAPGITSQLVHPVFAAVNQFAILCFLGYVWLVFFGKLGLGSSGR